MLAKQTLFSKLTLFLITLLPCILAECQPPKKIISFDDWQFKDSKDDGGYFTPLALKNDTNIVKEMLQGSSLNPDQDLKKICIRVQYNEQGNEASVVGFNNVTSQFNCSRIGDGKEWAFDCQHQNGKPDFNYKAYATLTDKTTSAFVVRCWKNGLRGWTMLSTRKEVHDNPLFHILEHAKSLGFESADAFPLSYKSCKK